MCSLTDVVVMSRRRARARVVLGLLVVVITSLSRLSFHLTPVRCWWDVGHAIVSSRSICLMPDPWRPFLGYYEFYLNETSASPDTVYKNLDPEEDFRHFIDLEIWAPRKPETGTLPYAVERFAAEAAKAMRGGDWNKAFYDLGRVSHYIADVHQPYHSTVDYNPKNKRGSALHGLLDSAMEVHYDRLNVTAGKDIGALEPVQNLTSFCFQIAWQSHSFLGRMNQILIEEEKEWSPELDAMLQNRTNSAIISVARVWYTIVLRAGVTPPKIPEPNVLNLDTTGILKELDPERENVFRISITDSLGIFTPAFLQVSLGNTPLNVYNVLYVTDPLGKYTIPLPKDMLSQLRGKEARLSLTAERPGYVSGRFDTMIKVAGLSPELIQSVVGVGVAAVAIAVAGFAYSRMRRRRRVVIDR